MPFELYQLLKNSTPCSVAWHSLLCSGFSICLSRITRARRALLCRGGIRQSFILQFGLTRFASLALLTVCLSTVVSSASFCIKVEHRHDNSRPIIKHRHLAWQFSTNQVVYLLFPVCNASQWMTNFIRSRGSRRHVRQSSDKKEWYLLKFEVAQAIWTILVWWIKHERIRMAGLIPISGNQ